MYMCAGISKYLSLLMRYVVHVYFLVIAGTGKSVLLRSIISHFAQDKTWRNLGITASTGIAAENIGGRTLHSFAGIGLGKGKAEDLVEAVKNSTFSRMRWIETEVLIIDESQFAIDLCLVDFYVLFASIITNFEYHYSFNDRWCSI